MSRDRDIIDWIIAKTLGPFIARWHRRRIERRQRALESIPPEGFALDDIAGWHAENPGRCMYCAYTKWANEEHGQALKIEPHRCREGNSPPMELPVARVVR